MSIRTKAWLLIIIITLSVSGICGNFIFSLRRMNAIDENLKIMNQINIKLLECRRQEKNYQLRGLAVHGQDRLNSVEKWETLLATGLSLTKKAEKNLGPRYINSLNAVNREINEYKKVFQGLVKTDQNNPRSWDTFLEKKLVDRARASQTLIQKNSGMFRILCHGFGSRICLSASGSKSQVREWAFNQPRRRS
ncbi:MAG: hypothetical protein HUK40_16440 [Desulfobacter sp.]|nr:hypothetical protein [Desulfobacter sp.]